MDYKIGHTENTGEPAYRNEHCRGRADFPRNWKVIGEDAFLLKREGNRLPPVWHIVGGPFTVASTAAATKKEPHMSLLHPAHHRRQQSSPISNMLIAAVQLDSKTTVAVVAIGYAISANALSRDTERSKKGQENCDYRRDTHSATRQNVAQALKMMKMAAPSTTNTFQIIISNGTAHDSEK